jgi:hypothetical protein
MSREISATIDDELYLACMVNAQHRFGATARMSDYVRTALVQLERRDSATRAKTGRGSVGSARE